MSTHPNPPLAPLSAEDFKGWANHNDVDLIEDENASWVIGYGHVDKGAFAAAVNAYDAACDADAQEDDGYTASDVQHQYAVVIEPKPEWWITYVDVTAETPGSFPITVVTR